MRIFIILLFSKGSLCQILFLWWKCRSHTLLLSNEWSLSAFSTYSFGCNFKNKKTYLFPCVFVKQIIYKLSFIILIDFRSIIILNDTKDFPVHTLLLLFLPQHITCLKNVTLRRDHLETRGLQVERKI
jgi:hypothetical protein